MGFIETERIIGYNFDTEIICCGCATDEEKNKAKEEEIITEDMIEDNRYVYFCDRCKKRL